MDLRTAPETVLPPPVPTPSVGAARPVAAAAAGMRRPRVWLVYAMLFVIVAGHLVDMAVQREHWPFSHYPMWSIPAEGWEVKREMFRGVTDEPTPREVPVVPREHLYPIPHATVVVQMQHAARYVAEMRKAEAEAEKLRAAGNPADAAAAAAAAKKRADAERIVNGLREHYTAGRAAGKHAGPPLKEIRLYEVTWQMDTDASAASRQNPVRTRLLYPVLTDARRAAAQPPVADRITSEFGSDDNND